jgi:nucleoside-diphosphate-sugar epimerase
VHVLVIGGTRFVGRLLVFRLLAAGHRVTVLNRGTLADPFGERIERLRGDRTTPDFARLLGGRSFDAVVDFAAFQKQDVTGAIAAFGEGRTGHYVFISTGQVYLIRQGCPTPACESDYEGPVMPRPDAPEDASEWDYGAGKRGCEDALSEAWARARFPATRIRIPMVHGERDYHRRLEGLLFRLLDGGPLLLPDGGRKPLRHVYGGEVARAIADLILDRPGTFGQAYNLCQDEMPSLREVLSLLAEMIGARPRFVSVAARDITAAGLDVRRASPFSGRWMSLLDPGKARSDLGFVHEPLRSYLGKIVASFLAHTPNAPPDGYRQRQAEIDLGAAISSTTADTPAEGGCE